MNKAFALFILVLFVAAPARADEFVPYAPEHCEFSIAFPTEPYKTRKCEDGKNDRCYDLVTYTQVYDLSATLSFQVICNPINKAMRAYYDGNVVEATLNAMSRDNNLLRSEASFREAEHYKQGGIVGEGVVNNDPSLYIGQIWIGEKSLLSVEAELIGTTNETADTLFSDILKTVQYKTESKPENSENESDQP